MISESQSVVSLGTFPDPANCTDKSSVHVLLISASPKKEHEETRHVKDFDGSEVARYASALKKLAVLVDRTTKYCYAQSNEERKKGTLNT